MLGGLRVDIIYAVKSVFKYDFVLWMLIFTAATTKTKTR